MSITECHMFGTATPNEFMIIPVNAKSNLTHVHLWNVVTQTRVYKKNPFLCRVTKIKTGKSKTVTPPSYIYTRHIVGARGKQSPKSLICVTVTTLDIKPSFLDHIENCPPGPVIKKIEITHDGGDRKDELAILKACGSSQVHCFSPTVDFKTKTCFEFDDDALDECIPRLTEKDVCIFVDEQHTKLMRWLNELNSVHATALDLDTVRIQILPKLVNLVDLEIDRIDIEYTDCSEKKTKTVPIMGDAKKFFENTLKTRDDDAPHPSRKRKRSSASLPHDAPLDDDDATESEPETHEERHVDAMHVMSLLKSMNKNEHYVSLGLAALYNHISRKYYEDEELAPFFKHENVFPIRCPNSTTMIDDNFVTSIRSCMNHTRLNKRMNEWLTEDDNAAVLTRFRGLCARFETAYTNTDEETLLDIQKFEFLGMKMDARIRSTRKKFKKHIDAFGY